MAIEVSIPKEITEYQEKILFGLSIRQLICIVTAIILSIGTYFLCTNVIGLNMDATSYVIIFEAMPLMALGFIKKDGMYFEKYIMLLIRHKSGTNKLKYQTDLVIEKVMISEKNERRSKYGWIFKKEKTGAADRNRKARKQEAAIRECQIYQTTKKGKKASSKAARRTIKAARKEYKRTKCQLEKEAKT